MARSQTCREDRRRRVSGADPRASDAAGAGKSTRAYFPTGKDVAAVGTRHKSTRPLDPTSARAVSDELDGQPIAIESADGPGDLEGYVRHIVDNAPPLTESQRGRLATLLRQHVDADRCPQESECYRGRCR